MGAPTWAWRGANNVPTAIFCHGAGGGLMDTARGEDVGLPTTLARDYVSMYGDMAGPHTWGTDPVIDQIHAYVLYARTRFGSSGKVFFSCASMGMLSVCNYARVHPENVAGIAGIIPLVDIQDLINNNGMPPELNAAYAPGGYNDATVGQTRSPIHMVENGLLDPDIPIKIWSVPSDTLTTLASHERFVAARPGTELQLLDAPGLYHGSIAVAAAKDSVINWFKEIA